jgi:hypothetical protein
VTTLGPTNMNKIETELVYLDTRIPAAALGYGTTLPGSPVDGQEYVLVDSTTNPSYQWRFRYNAGSSSAYKWEFVGGTVLLAQSAAFNVIGDSAWHAVTASPTLRAGEYSATAFLTGNCGGTAASWYVGVAVTGSATANTAGVTNVAANAWTTIGGLQQLYAPGAGGSLSSYYLASQVASSANVVVGLIVTPKRVS